MGADDDECRVVKYTRQDGMGNDNTPSSGAAGEKGDGEGQASIVGGDGGEEDQMVDVEKLIEQFDIIKTQELKPNTRTTYTYAIKKFAKFINLEKKTCYK
jgi:hypothetical protein